jgi:hypothetical protein
LIHQKGKSFASFQKNKTNYHVCLFQHLTQQCATSMISSHLLQTWTRGEEYINCVSNRGRGSSVVLLPAFLGAAVQTLVVFYVLGFRREAASMP